LEWGLRPKAPINAHKKKARDTTYDQALAAATVREGMEIVKKNKARDYCLHGEAIERLGPDHDGIVFDDMSFDHWPPESVIHLLDMECERALHVRYGTVTIPAYTKKIFTSNKKNIFTKIDVEIEQFNAISRRYKDVVIDRCLFSVDTVFSAQLNAYQQMVGAHRPIPTLSLPPLDPSVSGEMDEVD